MGMSAIPNQPFINVLGDLKIAGLPLKMITRAYGLKTSIARNNIRLIEMISDEDRRATVMELEERTGFPILNIQKIMKDELEMSWIATRWVTKLVLDDKKL
ncbi:hypothetical protein LOD99_5542 [Oopsacas minuta]|uniref:Uncharacterized protein n=1 Tax=Oopsacas minuta TaxID=111878 RepID=A0AAV7JS33_9METZ|nr:hypothetical protein LOD99_5542 [Oopsacas minuta]